MVAHTLMWWKSLPAERRTNLKTTHSLERESALLTQMERGKAAKQILSFARRYPVRAASALS